MFATLVVSVSVGSEAQERLAWRPANEGRILLQVQNARAAHYMVLLRDLLTGCEAGRATDFTAGPGSAVFSSEWQSTATNALLSCHLFRDGQEVPLPTPPLQLPELWDVQPAELDRRRERVAWSLDRPCLARVRALLTSGLELAVLRDWHFSSGARQTTAWDFWDQHRTAEFRGSPALRVWVQYLPLPASVVVVGEPAFDDYRGHSLFQRIELPRLVYDFEVTVRSSGMAADPGATSSAVARAGPGTALLVRLAPQTRSRLGQARYEVLLFVDGEFLREDTEAVDPCAMVLPPLSGYEGIVTLSIMVRDYEGNAGARTVRVWYVPQPNEP